MRRTSDYRFDLPPSLIAQQPVARRDASRLLDLSGSEPMDRDFLNLVELLPADAVLVVNDTKVIRARLRTQKQESGGAVELLLLEPMASDRQWRCLAKASKAVRDGCLLRIVGTEIVCRTIGDRESDGSLVVEFPSPVFDILEAHGELPLPPYIERSAGDTPADRERYQTVFAQHEGAVAAPTAGLHFSNEILAALDARGITRAPITLHVGLGTFAPVRVESLDDIALHEERFHISDATAALVASGRPIVAVGTTVVRALESAALADKLVGAGAGRTRIFISPGYRFRVVDALVTNFHLPESTLLMLVCAFAGYARVMAAYRHAVEEGYRFFSYGDAMLLTRGEGC